jgi:glycolate oxidase
MLGDTLREIVGGNGVLDTPEELMLYEYDGGLQHSTPQAVVFPTTTAQVAAVVKLAAAEKLPILARGAGTGLSGGAIAISGGIVLSTARMNRILKLDCDNQRAVVQPGVVNLEITQAAAPQGYFYAPDPSSQKACTIGGNVAENAGGPHTLAYGVTTNHVLGLEMVLPDGTIMRTGGEAPDTPGYDLTGLIVGSEGTLGIVTEVTVRLMRAPEAVKTLLGVFNSIDEASRAVADITAQAIIPVALEMIDGWTLRAVEAATHSGFPTDAEAVLLIELEGLQEVIDEQFPQVEQVCRKNGAREVRVARTSDEREKLWAGRKGAFGAIGQYKKACYVQDGVVPRTQLPATMRKIQEVAKTYDLTIGNIFHAGDGNLHPLILFDAKVPGEYEKVVRAGTEILTFCISVGGSLTGEHGVGIEKRDIMPLLFSEDDLEMMRRVKATCNPTGLLNPLKVLPAYKTCLEVSMNVSLDAHPFAKKA